MNRVILIGNLCKDPELRQTPNGVSVCTFTLAVSRNFTGQNGERETDFINVVVWRKQAENSAKYLRKGSQAAVAGRIQVRSYDAQDGSKRYVAEVVADEVEYLKKPAQSENIKTEERQDIGQAMEINENMPF